MAYDAYDYDIINRLPEWWKNDTFLEPVNRYINELIHDLVGGLLESFSVTQPFNIWKTLPTEYSWLHTYMQYDSELQTPEGETSPLQLKPNKPLYAYVPNSKRNCHGSIFLQLEGDDYKRKKNIKTLTLRNANQIITIHNIKTTTSIEIFTESNTILIDGVERSDLVDGSFHKIYPEPQNPNYDEVDIDDENKITYISLESDTKVNFSLKIKLNHPVYVTEQNMRIHTVSAFPIEWVRLYGFFCHEFNDKQEWELLWEKYYKEEENIVFDRITKQFDCETFYMQVKLYGIAIPYTYGFPQETISTNPAFQTNAKLDKWGKIFGLPRRYYKTYISEDEEPYTYPPFYNYEVEQDYWYEERLINEYRHNSDAINAGFVKDTDYNNVGVLKCIDPSIENIYVYTETIDKTVDNTYQTNGIPPTEVVDEQDGVSWEKPIELTNLYKTVTEVDLKPQGPETFNSRENQSKVLKLDFNDIPDLPKNIEIKGLELQLEGSTNIHSDALKLDDRSKMLLPVIYVRKNGEIFKNIDPIPINNDFYYWEKDKKIYKIGGPDNLFNLTEITMDQIKDGLTFNLGFTNENTFLKANIALYSVKFIIYYKELKPSYDIEVILDKKEIVLEDEEEKHCVGLKIKLKNTGDIPVVDKNICIVLADGLKIKSNLLNGDISSKIMLPTFDLDVGEEFIIGGHEEDKLTIILDPEKEKKTGLYDIIVFCDEQSIKNTILVKTKNIKQNLLESIISINNRFYIEENIDGYLRTENKNPIKNASLDIDLNNEE